MVDEAGDRVRVLIRLRVLEIASTDRGKTYPALWWTCTLGNIVTHEIRPCTRLPIVCLHHSPAVSGPAILRVLDARLLEDVKGSEFVTSGAGGGAFKNLSR